MGSEASKPTAKVSLLTAECGGRTSRLRTDYRRRGAGEDCLDRRVVGCWGEPGDVKAVHDRSSQLEQPLLQAALQVIVQPRTHDYRLAGRWPEAVHDPHHTRQFGIRHQLMLEHAAVDR